MICECVCVSVRGRAGGLFSPPVQPGPGEGLSARLEAGPGQTSVPLSLI